MGDNIRDAALKDFRAAEARKGWAALSEQAGLRGVLKADYGTTCLRLSGGRVMIDRTNGFSEEEYYRVHKEYEKFGITAYWVVSVSEHLSDEFMKRSEGRILRMMHPHRSSGCFVIDGVRHSLDGGLDYVLEGSAGSSTVIEAKTTSSPMLSPVKHRNQVRRISCRPETASA